MSGEVIDRWNTIRREGNILLKLDNEDETGFYSKFLVLHLGLKYECDMKNGKVIKLIELGAA